MLITFLAFATLTVVILLVALFVLYPRKRKVSTVPGLDVTNEKLGNIGEIRDAGSMHEFLTQLHHEYGPIASFWLGPQFCISVAKSNTFKEVQQLLDRPKCLFEFCIPLIGEKSIQFSNGEDGMRRHKIYSEVLGHATCCRLIPKFVQIGQELVTAWKKLPPDEHVPVHAYMMAVAIKMLSATQFGAYFRSDDVIKNFHQLYEKVMDDMNGIMTGSFSKKDRLKFDKFQTNLKNFQTVVKDLIKTHARQRESGDYHEAPLLNSILDNSRDDEEIFADVVAFVVGGFHTTGNFLAWLIYYLSICPEVQKKIIVEIDCVLRGKLLDETSASQLTYTWQVLEETLRASVTAPFAARVCKDRDLRVHGHLIQAGTPIVCALGVSLSDPQFYEDPGKFDPDRFSAEAVRKRPSVAFSPFGLGQRRCPGNKFSKFEALSIVVTLLQNFSFKPAFDNDYFVEPSFGFVTKPESEIWINIKSRD